MMDPFDKKENIEGEEIKEEQKDTPLEASPSEIDTAPVHVEDIHSESSAPQTGYSANYSGTYQNQGGYYSSYGSPVPPYGAAQENGYNAGQANTNYGSVPPQAPYQPTYTQPNQTVWQGNTYRSGPVYTTPGPPQKPQKEKKPKKPWSRGKKLATGAVACLLCCAVVCTASIAGFTALVNNGTIKLSGSQSSGTGTASNPITINRLVNSDGSPALPSDTKMSMSEIAEKLIPSVVCIQNYQRAQSGSNFGMGGNGQSSDSGLQDAGEGSGIILTEDGYIVTNAHVISGADALKVVLSDGTTYEAKLVGSDEVSDLAVIKVEATGLSAAEFGSSDDLRVAEAVMAIGNPGGLEFNSSVTIGYVSALNRSVTNSDGYTIDYIQTDAAINPGNSGGALVNMAGQVIGINTAKISDTNYEGLGFAIPSNTAQTIINDLIKSGSVQNRAALGVTGRFIDSMTARLNNVPTGWYVYTVTNESAKNAGLTQGCIITQIDGTAVAAENTIKSILAKKKAGDMVALNVTNTLSGQEFKINVTLVQTTASSNETGNNAEDSSSSESQNGSNNRSGQY